MNPTRKVNSPMKIPEYVTKPEVRKVCKELKIRDWTALQEAKVPPNEARRILNALQVKGMKIPLVDFIQGLEVELEHGVRFRDANVTNNHPLLTGKIVLAHFKETLHYYKLLDVAEFEGDMQKAAVAGDAKKLLAKYRKLVQAKVTLNQAISNELG
jgi:hypothetical protein